MMMMPSPDVSSARSLAHLAPEEHPRRILLIGDDELTQRATAEPLRREGYEVRSVQSDESSLMALRTLAPDLVVVDVQQPITNELNLVRSLQEAGGVPILTLGPASHAHDHLIRGDEYLSKPFQESDLLRRVKTLLTEEGATRVGPASEPAARPPEVELRFGDLAIRPRLREVERDGVPVELSATEFDLLYFLASHPRQVFTRQQLLDRVWHYQYFGDARTVTVHMSRLRKKVEPDPANPRHLRTVWRVGYKFIP